MASHLLHHSPIKLKKNSCAEKIGFVSLGCPKALVDSELILTQLSAEGYETAKDYSGADLVVVNTCGFIDSAVEESLSAIGEALAENGKAIVTGCLGARKNADGSDLIQSIHPKVLAVTGPHATDEVMQAIHAHLPKPHDPLFGATCWRKACADLVIRSTFIAGFPGETEEEFAHFSTS